MSNGQVYRTTLFLAPALTAADYRQGILEWLGCKFGQENWWDNMCPGFPNLLGNCSFHGFQWHFGNQAAVEKQANRVKFPLSKK